MRILATALMVGGLAGCAPVSVYQPALLVALPGPAKTQAAFHQDDADCRIQAAALPAPPSQAQATQAPLRPGEDPSADPARLAGVTYFRCMTARNNVVELRPQQIPVLYSYYEPMPIYGDYGDGDYFPWLYPGGVHGFGGYHGGYRYAGGYRGFDGYRGFEGYRGGYEGARGFQGREFGGFHGGGGFGGGGFHGGGFGGHR